MEKGAEVVKKELERELLEDYLETLDREFGKVPTELFEHYDRLWPS